MIKRIRRASGVNYAPAEPPPAGTYRGFGTVPGETLAQFHERMFGIDGLEAAMYEFEVELEKDPSLQ